jgi:hypothetical protein
VWGRDLEDFFPQGTGGAADRAGGGPPVVRSLSSGVVGSAAAGDVGAHAGVDGLEGLLRVVREVLFDATLSDRSGAETRRGHEDKERAICALSS